MPETKTSEPSNASENQAQQKQDNNLTMIPLIAIGLGATLIMAIFAPQALYILIGAISLVTFAIYPQIEIKHVLWGACFGLIFIGGPIGLIIGAGLGHFLGKKFEEFMAWAEPIVVKATAPFTGAAAVAIQVLKGPAAIIALAAKTNNALGRISNATSSLVATVKGATPTSVADAIGNATCGVINAIAATDPNNAPSNNPQKGENLLDAVLKEQSKTLQFLTDTNAGIIGTKDNTTVPTEKAQISVSNEAPTNQARRPRRGQRIVLGLL